MVFEDDFDSKVDAAKAVAKTQSGVVKYIVDWIEFRRDRGFTLDDIIQLLRENKHYADSKAVEACLKVKRLEAELEDAIAAYNKL